jgi:hypothetical protein
VAVARPIVHRIKRQSNQQKQELNMQLESRDELAPGIEHHQIRAFQAGARNCAMCMLENATFIEQELAKMQIAPRLRSMVEEICSDLIGTKHDIITELFELDDLLETNASAQRVEQKIDAVVALIRDDVRHMHPVVMALMDEPRRGDDDVALASLLVAESATNILQAFMEAQSAANACSSGDQ